MKMSVAPALTTDHQKILQAKFTLVQEDEFYEITKNAKNKFEYKLKDGYVAGLKDHKKKSMENSFGIENKLLLNFIVNKYIDIEKRLTLSEYKRNKDKKKIKRITNDLYETDEYENKNPQPIDKQDQTQPTDDNFESKLKSIIDDKKEVEDNKQQSDNQQYDTSFKLASRTIKNEYQY
jgi:hypothetical protein